MPHIYRASKQREMARVYPAIIRTHNIKSFVQRLPFKIKRLSCLNSRNCFNPQNRMCCKYRFLPTGIVFSITKIDFNRTCLEARRTTSWMVPRMFPSDDMDRLSVSMAAWLERPTSDSPFTAISWSFIFNLPSCYRKRKMQNLYFI